MTARAYILLITFPFLVPAPGPAQTSPILDTLAISVQGESREYAYTNKESAFLYGETGGPNRSSWQGFNVFGQEFLDDYLLIVDGAELRREEALTVRVFPDHLVREYPGGVIEQIRPVDSVAVFGVIVTAPRAISLTIIPLVTDGRTRTDFRIAEHAGTAALARVRHPERTASRNYPVWLALHADGARVEHDPLTHGTQFGPFRMVRNRSRTHILAFAVGDREEEAVAAARRYVADPARAFRSRRARMELVLRQTEVVTEDALFNRALAWAKLSLDALMMNQVTKGIFAGLPWFNNYWGRDTFIALPGATLVTGRFRDAVAILRSFMAFQNTDSLSREFGRIPNIVTTTDTAYNTADGTPRFVITAAEYVVRSGDTSFVREVYPVVRRATDAALERHADFLGFLRHADAETWMDAVGPEGPWSPRGDRANDIQALWDGQLRSAAWMAGAVGDTAAATRWVAASDRLRSNFAGRFLTAAGVADRLSPEGRADTRIRPNQIFTLDLLPEPARRAMVETVTSLLTYEYGVASLAQSDEDFHPWHQYEPYYPKDAAYHNGTVWTWLQGPLITALCRYGSQDLAFRITANSVGQILDRDAAGTQAELLDALPRPGAQHPNASGTFSQAWNLAEFVRNFYDDYLGIRIDRTAHTLTLRPRVPRKLGRVQALINMDGRGLRIDLRPTGKGITAEIDARVLQRGGTVMVTLQDGPADEMFVRFPIPPRSRFRIAQDSATVLVQVNGRGIPVELLRSSAPRLPEDLALATPRRPEGLRALRGPEYPLLTHDNIVAELNPGGHVVASASDPPGDDTGTESDGAPGSFAYPRAPQFVPGSLDLTGFSLSANDSSARFVLTFAALSNPGWHPEYGFQLTYVAIAIDKDGAKGTGKRDVGWNSGFTLPEGRGFERLVLVGGGVRMEDESGTPLAAYIPASGDAAKPFGDAAKSSIGFTIPLALLGRPEPGWTLYLLVGAQDDHGGAGLGEFRQVVTSPAAEWSGGGKKRESSPNVYDMLTVQTPEDR